MTHDPSDPNTPNLPPDPFNPDGEPAPRAPVPDESPDDADGFDFPDDRVPSPSAPPGASGHIDARPILEIEEDLCPKCHAVLRAGEVVCVRCGFDLRHNVSHKPRVGVDTVAAIPTAAATGASVGGVRGAGGVGGTSEPSDAASPWRVRLGRPAPLAPDAEEFSADGRGSAGMLMLLGGILALSAAGFAAANAWKYGALIGLGQSVLTIYECLLATGAGVAAAAIVARLSEMRLGRPDLVVARIFIAFAAFQFVRGVAFPGPQWLVHTLMWIVGAAVYWGLAMFLFRKSKELAGYLLATHFMIWLVLMGGMEFAGMVRAAQAARAAQMERFAPSTDSPPPETADPIKP